MKIASEPRWDDGLTGVVLAIARCEASALRVLAGPGTGKTYAMKRRVMRLLQEDVAPGRVLACTFTRTAARDIAKEIANLGIEGAGDVRAGTLHVGVIRFRGHLPRGGYDVHDGRDWESTDASAVYR